MKALVEFVGAGPGAEDLITVRGLRALEQADLVVYAGSLVNPAHLKACKADCTCLDSASMNLGEQIEAMSDAALTGKRVVRLHTGDPAMYGAINEQIRGLAQKGVAASIIPGVSSVFAAAAALGCELTSPDVSQSVVLTRTPGRTPMPQGEDAAAFARTGAMLVFFLSTGKVGELMRHLMEQGGLAEGTPAAIVYRASWPDERILRGTVGDIARQAEEAGLGRQALVIVGRALGANGTASRLYDADFSHGYRNRLVSEDFDGRCALYAFTDKGLTRAREIAAGLGLPTVLHSTHPSGAEGIVHIPAQDFDSRLAANWAQFDAHIFIGATGIPFRKAAPLLRDKNIDPAVLACPESGSHVIALTSGHFGGTNRLARRIARITGGQAVIGSPADVNSLPAFDEAAAQEHARILNPEAVRALNAALLDGSPIAFCGTRAVFERHFASTGQVAFFENPQDVTCGHAVLWDSENTLPEEVLYLDVSSRAFVLGVGCRRGVKPQELRLVAERYLSEFGLNAENIAGIATCTVKEDEPAILGLGEAWQVPVAFHSAEELDAVPVSAPSEKVREKVGTASVCEAACLLSAGYGSIPQPALYAPKSAFGDVTLALARLPHLPVPKSGQGEIVVAGLGSGAPGHITPDVDTAIRRCDTVAGYSHYVDFIRDRIAGKPVIQNGMKGEVERCLSALEAALAGQNVCMVCSGDPGILAMAGLLYELRTREPRFRDIPIRVLPGITAATIAASSLGAPLQNGFSLVSLSDLLVSADEVRRNIRSVAQSLLPVALYNPAGRKRRDLLEETLAVFREHRGEDVLCAYVKNAGREQETKWLGKLSEFPAAEVDMSTLIIIGGPRTRLDSGVLYEPRGYVEKYME
ncbi:precorrin-4 C(11)-methyltransferase [Bilophila wadsworthia]|jgi:cobalt-precorrin 5A hydrolase/precorrin-3B C17-methyltransferase|uniref:precorrin-4 C(11)-methyltransferase n=1 Tax=Bilophila wadsworthia TaxID=35833 RepID=UPI002673B6C4|nr:precorrin-4 C(11)-methyltransferase [Bilophila wadsworthia]